MFTAERISQTMTRWHPPTASRPAGPITILRNGLKLAQLSVALLFASLTSLPALADDINTSTDTTIPTKAIETPIRHPDVINPPMPGGPLNEFHIARLVFDTNSYHGWGPGRPWWRIDWPEAEAHFLDGLGRYTAINIAPDSIHVELGDDAIFDHPWLFAQQVGRWRVSDHNAQRLGEYLRRGGFLLADDIHGPNDWATFSEVMRRALPHHRIVTIKPDDAVMTVLYELDQNTQIPGRRHIIASDGQGNTQVRMPHGPPQWRGIRDEDGRWMVAINFNMDMGDSWEHADDPYYPLRMTSLGYQFGINYVIYALTH